MKRLTWKVAPAVVVLSLLSLAAASAEGPPLPLHSVEGAGGIFATLHAYLVNPPAKGQTFGRPAAGFIDINLGHGRELRNFTLTETVTDRVELGYSNSTFDLGDLPTAIFNATGVAVSRDNVVLSQFNVRALLAKEKGDSPAVTLGVHFKHNEGRSDLDADLGGVLTSIGVAHSSGTDYTLYASKALSGFARPVLVTVGLRSTAAAHTGLLGFTDKRATVGEGNVVVLLSSRFALAGEYRQKPNSYTAIPGLIEPEDDWWTLAGAYILDNNTTLAGGYAHFGRVLNHDANGSWGLALKHEF
jgi:hypothetical protein